MNIVAAITLATAPAYAVVYSGSLTSGNGLTGTGPWAEDASISWNVSNEDLGYEGWNYSYTLTVTGKDISHAMIEVSSVFENSNILEGYIGITPDGTYELNDYGPSNPSNPGIPDTMRGIKIDVIGDTKTLSWSFDSDITPVWGDFYAKDGKQGGADVYIYNDGFTENDYDPTTPVDPDNQDYVPISDHIIVPDSTSTHEGPPGNLPEPGTSMLGALGILLLFKRQKK
jgi:hypothetical protein